jgi:hypothetical protein
VDVLGHLGHRDRVEFLAHRLALGRAGADMHGDAAAQVGQGESGLPVAAYMVPSSEKSAWFWLIGRNCPLAMAQPLGAKLNETILSSPKNGVLIF